MTKIAKSPEAVYIYIVRFNKISLCEHRANAMLFRRIKNSIMHSFFEIFSVGDGLKSKKSDRKSFYLKIFNFKF